MAGGESVYCTVDVRVRIVCWLIGLCRVKVSVRNGDFIQLLLLCGTWSAE